MVRPFILLFLACFLAFPAFSQEAEHSDSLLLAVASPGDGAYSLLRKHGINPGEFLTAFMEINAQKLGEDGQLSAGTTYFLPVTESGDPVLASGPAPPEVVPAVTPEDQPEEEPKDEAEDVASGSEPDVTASAPEEEGEIYEIFGPEYERVSPESKRLEGTVYYLVSGHGGPDPGAMTKYGGKAIAEDEYAYDITLRLGRYLLSHGAMVYIIIRDPDDGIRDERILPIDHDEVAYPDKRIPLNQLARLKQRTEAVNKLYAKHRGKHQRLIVTHVDSRSSGQNIDVFFYHHEKSTQGKRLAEHIHKTFQQKYAYYQPNRKYNGTFKDRSNLYVVKNTHPPTAFIEVGNISNKKDQRRILDPDNRQALANWICEGILTDYESRKKD
ncbi:N-acetylmuramoyl-L-alanine amidase [Robiginitalea myxolifaciens]|uniref:N-acetylmuramoyl-L-alanine amidase n=1 Tax=Robiginitalea myxolifaciens TaxID=400055 RepID=A0A1I6GA77_9FLAO|nr:N-acetylmuramoyl-L-alanine amidase [Robiginitalea myxolifaciens]SFR39112.1 N-acetylmuramoyl-L-alanine amidase [Robiginitalea myxolifaciens]